MNAVVLRSMILALAVFSAAEAGDSVVVGHVRYVQEKDIVSMKHDRAFYEHENHQYFVVKIDCVLVGEVSAGSVLVGVTLTGKELPGLRIVNANYAVLDPEVWRDGTKVIIVFQPSGPLGGNCSPPVIMDEEDESASNDLRPYLDSALDVYRRLPVYCADDDDLFVVRE